MAMVYECAWCHQWHCGAAYSLTTAPRDPWGRVERAYYDNKMPLFGNEECRDAYEAAKKEEQNPL